MTTIINAVSGTGLTQTADGSGICKIQSNGVTTNALAWVNFNGVTTASIIASYNVSSVTRNSTGNYTVSFTNAMTDANYCTVASNSSSAANAGLCVYPISATQYGAPSNKTTTGCQFLASDYTAAVRDVAGIYIVIFGN